MHSTKAAAGRAAHRSRHPARPSGGSAPTDLRFESGGRGGASVRTLVEHSQWAAGLAGEQIAQVVEAMHERSYARGAIVARSGQAAHCWYGVIEGVLSAGAVSAEGRETGFSGFLPGGWFGEGPLLRRGVHSYDCVVMVPSRIAVMPGETFHWLRRSAPSFNDYLLDRLSRRLELFAHLVQDARPGGGGARVAQCLLMLLQSAPDAGPDPARGHMRIRISQERIARLAGLSRQAANQVLQRLRARGAIELSYGAVTVLEPALLRRCI